MLTNSLRQCSLMDIYFALIVVPIHMMMHRILVAMETVVTVTGVATPVMVGGARVVVHD